MFGKRNMCCVEIRNDLESSWKLTQLWVTPIDKVRIDFGRYIGIDSKSFENENSKA